MPETKKKIGRPKKDEYISLHCKLCGQPGEIMLCGDAYCAECVAVCQIDKNVDDCEHCVGGGAKPADAMAVNETATPIPIPTWCERAVAAIDDGIREQGAEITEMAIRCEKIGYDDLCGLNRLAAIKRELGELAKGKGARHGGQGQDHTAACGCDRG